MNEKLADFAAALSGAVTAPDGYPEWGYVTYESNMADLKSLWSELRPQLKRDTQRIEDIDKKLTEMFRAFAQGEKEKGQEIAWALYNLKVKSLR
ncbi:hypothetical protein [Cupriavidus sp. WS]|uniref:hypothetical protein n=1 Tax=Cupriavidus sp. WS TaxID=1312922 RepID=UPI0018CBB165|nr:hypothetical protein [Cupriavidus sp. WS]